MVRRLPLLLLLLFWLCQTAVADELNGRVRWIYDGDTLQVEGVGRVRLLGIDTPETEDSPRDQFYRERFHLSPQTLRSIARQAKQYTLDQAKGRRVRLETDREQRDQYDRLLAYVFLPDGQMLNRQLLEKGLATVFRRFDFNRKAEFLAAEARARSAQLGLWQPHP